MASGKRIGYPKIVTTTCANCGDTVDVRLDKWEQKRDRYYCSDSCKAEYTSEAIAHNMRVRNGKKTGEWNQKKSTIISERPATASDPHLSTRDVRRERMTKGPAQKPMSAMDQAYFAALRRSKGIETSQTIEGA